MLPTFSMNLKRGNCQSEELNSPGKIIFKMAEAWI
jgi:hypothetical protein